MIEAPEPPSSSPAHDAIDAEVVLLHGQHAGSLLRYAGSIAESEETARDAVQETFLRYFIERSYGRRIANPRAWLYQVLRNYISDRMNAASAQREIASEHIDRIASHTGDPEALADRSQRAREIEASLSGRELECLQLRTEGLSYEEIGAAMNVRIGTVGALLSRVHDKIRQRAESEGGAWMEYAAAVCQMIRGGKTCIPS